MLTLETQTAFNFDELTSIQAGWNFEAAQLSPMEEESRVTLYQSEHVAYNRLRLNSAYDQRLHSKPGVVSFGLLAPDCPVTGLYEHVVPNDGLIVFPRDHEMKAVSRKGFSANGMHFTAAFLADVAEVAYRRPLDEIVPFPGVYQPDATKLQAVRTELYKWDQLAAQDAGGRASIVSRREEGLALAVLDALSNAHRVEQPVGLRSGRALNRALEVIHHSDLENIRALELCTYAGCSQRSLEKSFSARFGVTPKKYIKCLRLARVHQALRSFDVQDCQSIIELAGIHGFWHMGQFAADYRAIYGESPSQTLKRG